MVSIFGNKKFDDISYKDIDSIVKREVQESYFLDYKKDFSRVKKGEIETSEIGKDVSSFANTYGGWLIYGIETEKVSGTKAEIPIKITGVEEINVEDRILGSISPKPLFRVKSIPIKNSDKSIILIFVRQSYDALHMVNLKKEMRFYKRYDYQAIPMDEREIELRFKFIRQSETEKEYRIEKIINEGVKFTGINRKDNLCCLLAIPKFFLKNHFNDEDKIMLFHQRVLFEPFSLTKRPRRRSNRFFFELTGRNEPDKGALNFYYDGIVSLIIPLFELRNTLLHAPKIYTSIYKFLCIVEKYFSLFDFFGTFEIHFYLSGIEGRQLSYYLEKSRTTHTDHRAAEEIEPYIKTCDLSELGYNKPELSREMILPLYYSFNFDSVTGCFINNGIPKEYFNEHFLNNVQYKS